jgi:hypothetical protein
MTGGIAALHRPGHHQIGRATLDPQDVAEVDRLVDEVAAVLSGRENADAIAAGEVLVFGVAALVTRRTDLPDEALRALVGRRLSVRETISREASENSAARSACDAG